MRALRFTLGIFQGAALTLESTARGGSCAVGDAHGRVAFEADWAGSEQAIRTAIRRREPAKHVVAATDVLQHTGLGRTGHGIDQRRRATPRTVDALPERRLADACAAPARAIDQVIVGARRSRAGLTARAPSVAGLAVAPGTRTGTRRSSARCPGHALR